jgi:RNA polymerase sigma factor (sigma-70 family)
MATSTADDILIGRILKGDGPAFRQLVERYQNLVFTIAYRITGNREEAEEVAQDAFMKAYNNLAGFKGDSKFSSWLYRITYNTALTKIRNRKEGFKDIDNVNETQLKASVLNEAEQRFVKEDLNNAIGMLEPEEATIITLFYLSEQSLDEIAATLNIEANTAKVRLFRARKKLREKMELIG